MMPVKDRNRFFIFIPDVFVNDFHEKYGGFEVRNVDWPNLTGSFRETLVQNPTEDNLFIALTGIIEELGDPHVSLSHPLGKFPTFEGGVYGELKRSGYEDFAFVNVLDNYLTIIDSIPERACCLSWGMQLI